MPLWDVGDSNPRPNTPLTPFLHSTFSLLHFAVQAATLNVKCKTSNAKCKPTCGMWGIRTLDPYPVKVVL